MIGYLRKYIVSGLIILLSLFSAKNVFCLDLSLNVERTKVYQGESLVVNLMVNGSSEEKPLPTFNLSDDVAVEYLGSSAQNHSSITIINGRTERTSFEGRRFSFQITPKNTNFPKNGTVTVVRNGKTLSRPFPRIEVAGIEARDDIYAEIVSMDKAILVESPFEITLKVSLRALEEPNSEIQPVIPNRPLQIESKFLNFEPAEGLIVPDADSALKQYVNNRDGIFTINNYESNDIFSFTPQPLRFVPRPIIEKSNGTNWWTYSFKFNYSPLAEGDYTFGPATIKGSIILGPDGRGNPLVDNVFVIANACTIRVIPPPEEGRPDCFLGSVGKSMTVTTSLDIQHCKLGDPLTLSLDIAGDLSLVNLRFPQLSMQKSFRDNFRIYEDNVETEPIPNGKRFKYRLRPLKSGTQEISPIKCAYFNKEKMEYVTVLSSPLPIQVDATEQISTSSPNENEKDEGVIPEALIHSKTDRSIFTLCPSLEKIGILPLIFAMPALCIATILVRIAIVMRRRRNERTKFGRAAASELRNLRTAIRRSKTMPFEVLGDASASVRKIVAHLLRSDNTTLSSVEVSSKLAHKGIDEATAKPLTAEMKRLEELPYIKSEEQAKVAGEIRPLLISLEARLVNLATRLEKQKEKKAATDWRAMVLILSFIAASSIPVYGDGLFSREPNAFQWEKAQNLMSRAQNEEDFAIASIQYNSMITNGASSGPLFYNFGTALLMEGKPLLAINALDQAAIYLGYSPEVKGNRVLAEKLYSGMETLPTSKYLLYLHYGLPVSDRMLYLLFAWNLAWSSIFFLLILPTERAKRIKTGIKVILVVAILSTLIFGLSTGVSYLQTRHGNSLYIPMEVNNSETTLEVTK